MLTLPPHPHQQIYEGGKTSPASVTVKCTNQSLVSGLAKLACAQKSRSTVLILNRCCLWTSGSQDITEAAANTAYGLRGSLE